MRIHFTPYLKASVGLLAVATLLSCSKKMAASTHLPVEKGVSKALADYRKEVITELTYALKFRIPAKRELPIFASESISFNLKEAKNPLQIDFKERTEHIKSVVVNGQAIEIDHREEHIIIPAKDLKRGKNTLDLEFVAGNLSLNRNNDYLYTLLVPDRARTVFPVFDQPNLKAAFQLALTLPSDWQALSNGPLRDSVLHKDTKTYHFATSDTMSTYLFSFAAGKFEQVSREINGRMMHFLHRETDPDKLKLSLEPIFAIHAEALKFMQAYTQIAYPFEKFDWIVLPDFQYGGMEHIGAIDYKAASLFLDEGATLDQKIARSSLISHETAHMWFGNLVTMQWFNDVWMKEVFANLMADKITQVALANTNYELKFLIDHFPAAYSVDRTAGANPIRQPLENLQNAGSLYGNIIYHKAPVMMRQLERLMGEKAFQAGLQAYLKTYAYGNATWPDLIKLLDARTSADLEDWNQVWVNQPGRPLFDMDLQTKDGKISQLLISQKAEDGSDRLLPQLFEITLVYPTGMKELTVNMNRRRVALKSAEGEPTPSFILFNSSGQGYGVFPTDTHMTAGLFTLKNPVTRAAAYINLYENMLNGRFVTAAQLLALYRGGIAQEKEELNLKLLTGQLSGLFWKFSSPAERTALAPILEKELWHAMGQHEASNSKKLLFKAYQNIALTQEAQNRLFAIWEKEQAPAGIKLTEDDHTALALALAVRDYPAPKPMLESQLSRIKNADRKKRLQFLMPALASDVLTRELFFASLKEDKNREIESWVTVALSYLHHPLRATTSQKHLKESLELLEEIQLTGDIFFPYSWLQATFGSYQTPEAAAIVRAFLKEHPTYNPKLKAKILQATDDLFRAEKLRSQTSKELKGNK